MAHMGAMAHGSHLVVIGHARAVRSGDAMPLTYFDGTYRTLAITTIRHIQEVTTCQ
jgi:hypothetical protein